MLDIRYEIRFLVMPVRVSISRHWKCIIQKTGFYNSQNKHTRLVPVVVFSASKSERDILQSYELGANGYVVKPVDFEEFTRVIHELGQYWLALNIPPSS